MPFLGKSFYNVLREVYILSILSHRHRLFSIRTQKNKKSFRFRVRKFSSWLFALQRQSICIYLLDQKWTAMVKITEDGCKYRYLEGSIVSLNNLLLLRIWTKSKYRGIQDPIVYWRLDIGLYVTPIIFTPTNVSHLVLFMVMIDRNWKANKYFINNILHSKIVQQKIHSIIMSKNTDKYRFFGTEKSEMNSIELHMLFFIKISL